MKRPTPREIDTRLKEAVVALKNRYVIFSNLNKVPGELEKLSIGDTDEVWELILQLMDEINIEHYAGGYPPQKNYEPFGKDCELWAFSWYSALLGRQMYLKFSIKEGMFYYVSLHESKFPPKK